MSSARYLVALIVSSLALTCYAGSLTCTGVLYFKPNFAGGSLNITLTPTADTDKVVVLDEVTSAKFPLSKSLKEPVNSALVMCKCMSANCTDDFPKVQLRVFADASWRKYGAVPKMDVNCSSYAEPDACTGALAWMPSGWGARNTGVALLYNLPDFALQGPQEGDKAASKLGAGLKLAASGAKQQQQQRQLGGGPQRKRGQAGNQKRRRLLGMRAQLRGLAH